VTRRTLLWHGGIELVLTTALIFGITSWVRWVVVPSPISRVLPVSHWRYAVIGAGLCVIIVLLIESPAGHASGAHMNPAISVGTWLFGTFSLLGVTIYAAAQLGGSVVGTLLARVVWGRNFTARPIDNAVLLPAKGWGSFDVFGVEAASVGIIVFLVGICLSTKRLSAWLPLVAGLLFGGSIVLLGTFTGASENPAREFGPALFSGETRDLWGYLCGPIVGALLAGAAFKLVRRAPAPSHSMCGTRNRSTRSGADETRSSDVPNSMPI
jgi:glycerol uptake facilitator-like aquaporin